MHIEYIAISKLKLLDNNPRRISKEQMDKLCRSIEEDRDFLLCRPVLCNRSGGIINVYAGNQRVRAAKKLKIKEVPCIVQDELDEKIMLERIIKDNKTCGEFDFDILANEWEPEMLIECGFSAEELLGDLSNISDDERNDGEKKEDPKKCETCGQKIK